ncbi:MAG: hypothetical protein DESF_01180 [Desulfovibrio sp.]
MGEGELFCKKVPLPPHPHPLKKSCRGDSLFPREYVLRHGYTRRRMVGVKSPQGFENKSLRANWCYRPVVAVNGCFKSFLSCSWRRSERVLNLGNSLQFMPEAFTQRGAGNEGLLSPAQFFQPVKARAVDGIARRGGRSPSEARKLPQHKTRSPRDPSVIERPWGGPGGVQRGPRRGKAPDRPPLPPAAQAAQVKETRVL